MLFLHGGYKKSSQKKSKRSPSSWSHQVLGRKSESLKLQNETKTRNWNCYLKNMGLIQWILRGISVLATESSSGSLNFFSVNDFSWSLTWQPVDQTPCNYSLSKSSTTLEQKWWKTSILETCFSIFNFSKYFHPFFTGWTSRRNVFFQESPYFRPLRRYWSKIRLYAFIVEKCWTKSWPGQYSSKILLLIIGKQKSISLI